MKFLLFMGCYLLVLSFCVCFLQPITRDMFDGALRILQDQDFCIKTNKTIRII